MTFWGLALILALLVAAIPGLALWRGRAATDSDAGVELALYRDQLAEVARDRERGVLDAGEAERLRVEISRRLLDADKRAPGAGGGARVARPVLAVVLGVAIVLGSALLYLRLGAPGYPDIPIADRLAASDAFMANRPSQAAYVAYLAQETDFDPSEFTTLAEAKAAHLEELGDAATGDDHVLYAELLIRAARDVYISPEAEAALAQALAIDPENGMARYHVGRMFLQAGRPDRTFEFWRALLERSDPGDPWVTPIAAQIEAVAIDAGIRYDLPDLNAERGPSAADIEAAAEMSAEDRAEMIAAMVAGLADRLAREGGTAAEWAQLVQALGVQGRRQEAGDIYREALEIFAGNAAALEQIEAAGRAAGVVE